jgi:pSer/pThr/pTyr-binding forkhead associated (FHA) protein
VTLTTGLALLGAAGGTSYSGVIRLVQWCVIALVFLFFLRVIRAVWVEVRPAGPRQTRGDRRRAAREERLAAAPPPGRRRGKELVLEVIEPQDLVGQRFEVDDEVSVGRSPGSGIATTYDIYSSTLHARLFRRDGRLWVEDLGSTNGTFVNSERITKPTKLGRGDLVQVGATVFEVSR